ncbi:pyruvate kinase, partial [Enterococcus faecalis]|uniref:pyruvate kinase n=1 Tax=Enterococcus faecalis TaxID=1351 RepID=UPI003CC53364
EIRTNDMENGAITMKIGDSVRISKTEVLGTNEKFSITNPELINDVNVGSHILLDVGLIDLEVTDIDRDANEIVTVV